MSIHFSNKKAVRLVLLLLLPCLIFWGVRHCLRAGDLKNIAYFEKISGVSFPENMKIVSCFDNGESYISIKAILDTDDVKSIIDKSDLKRIDGLDSLKNHTFNIPDVFIGEMNSFFESKDDKIIKSSSLFFLDSCSATNRIMFVFDKAKGFFWGIVQYPDFAGDAPCGFQ